MERSKPPYALVARSTPKPNDGTPMALPAEHTDNALFELFFSLCTLLLAILYFGLYDIGIVSYENYYSFESNISPPWPPFSWFGSKGMDVTDIQWYNFVRVIPIIFPFFTVFICASRWVRKRSSDSKDVTLLHVLHIIGGMMIGFGVSGPGFLFSLFLFLGNYFTLVKLHNKVSSRVFVALVWGSHVAILFSNAYFDGYGFRWLGFEFLDTFWNPMIRWTVHYNMSVLRMIAFNMDMHEATLGNSEQRDILQQKHSTMCIKCALIRGRQARGKKSFFLSGADKDSTWCYKYRTELPRSMHEYNLLGYFGYLLYPPLFIAGPVSSFNAYASHLHEPILSIHNEDLVPYGLRTLLNILLLIMLMHYEYVTAILFCRPVFLSISFPRRAVVLYLVLAFLWLKFSCVWKFFRLIALLDGVDVPEDMPRCFNSVVSIQGFWRDWHASFNLWIVRYMYVPLGGSKNKHLSIFPIFFFIAIWHDIEFRLIAWAAFVCVCFLFELFVTNVIFHPGSRLSLMMARHPLLYRYLRILGAAIVMLELLSLNLVGFSIGVDGAWFNLVGLWTDSYLCFCIITPIYFYCAAVISVYVRDYESMKLELPCLMVDPSAGRTSQGVVKAPAGVQTPSLAAVI